MAYQLLQAMPYSATWEVEVWMLGTRLGKTEGNIFALLLCMGEYAAEGWGLG